MKKIIAEWIVLLLTLSLCWFLTIVVISNSFEITGFEGLKIFIFLILFTGASIFAMIRWGGKK